MPTVRNDYSRGAPLFRFPGLKFRRATTVILSLGLALVWSSCERSPTQTQKSAPETQTSAAKKKTKKSDSTEGYAAWYDVPAKSLAKRRAGNEEYTAAHNRLPLGTKVRVTHLGNGKSVVVRVTDRGITDRHSMIDLCKEAAEELGMLSEGSARVRLEVLPDDKAVNASPDSKTAAAQP